MILIKKTQRLLKLKKIVPLLIHLKINETTINTIELCEMIFLYLFLINKTRNCIFKFINFFKN